MEKESAHQYILGNLYISCEYRLLNTGTRNITSDLATLIVMKLRIQQGITKHTGLIYAM